MALYAPARERADHGGRTIVTDQRTPTYATLRRVSAQDRARTMASGREWFRIVNRTDGRGTTYAEVFIYDEIGYYGITAGQFVAELGELDVDEIDLHLNSPGGEVWDGIAIYNGLVSHRARVTAMCEGIAASAASVVYMAGDERVMCQGAQLMIHDAWGVCVGNATDMAAMAERLNAESDNIAGFYAARSGGSVASWRKAMLAETWYSAEEAVAAGLADKVAKADKRTPESASDRWDLKVFGFRYEGREHAPAPTPTGGVHRDPEPSQVATPPIVRPPVAAPSAGQGPGPHNPPQPEPPAEPAAPPAEPEPDEDELSLGATLGSIFGDAVRAAAEPDLTIDAAMFREIVTHEATHMAAVPPPTPVVQEPTAVEQAAATMITDSLREAFT